MIQDAGPAHLVIDVANGRAACGSKDTPLVLLRHYAMHYRGYGLEACRACVDVVTANLLLSTELPDDTPT